METTDQAPEKEEIDVIEKTKELYDRLNGSLSTEKLLELRPFIKELADHCKTYNMFADAKDLYDKFVTRLDTVDDANKRIIITWNHLDDKLAVAPTHLHFKATIVLIIPLLDYALDKYEEQSVKENG